MSYLEAIEIIQNEARCVRTARTCDRQCEHCDLLREDDDILMAYATATAVLQHMHRKLMCELFGNSEQPKE